MIEGNPWSHRICKRAEKQESDMTSIDCGHGTHPGLKRECNEDGYCAVPELGLWAVADGMGGHESGEVASAIVIGELPGLIRQGQDLSAAIVSVHGMIQAAAERGEGGADMGSTVVAVRFDGPSYQIAWVGDSRAYLWNGELRQLTKDHSYVQLLLDAGLIEKSEAASHPSGNIISQALGGAEHNKVKVDRICGELHQGESLLLCSDGLHGEVTDEAIAAIFAAAADNQLRANRLIEAALAAGGKDNVTVIVLSPAAAA
jgi:protein phosphatase